MKKNLARAAVLAFLVLAMASPLFGQHPGPMKVNVPFNFVVENDRMPAGEYTIQKIANKALLIRGDGANSTAILIFRALPTEAKTAAEEGRLVFHRYGNEYFLSRIWTPGLEVGWEVLQGKLETELAKRRVPLQFASLASH